ncbi:MAG: STAS domain-containing protein [Victivallaceae bacterium]|nr:STAS domain-containing protein [Victivallaceae bacterium]
MSEGKILYSKGGQRYFLKMTGRLCFASGREFDKQLNIIFSDPAVKDIMIDMSETDYLDSTILGLMAKIADFMIKKFHKKGIILSDNKNINYLLDNIGLNNVFIVVESYDYTPGMLQKIPNIKSSELENALTILDAHKRLISLNEKNRNVFKDVVELLEQETK